MIDKLDYADRSGHVFKIGQHLVTFFVLYGLATKGDSISVFRVVMPTEWRGRMNITKSLRIIKPVRMQKVQQIGKNRNNK